MMTVKLFICFIILSQFTSAQWNKVEEVVSPYVFSVLFDGDNIYVGTDSLHISRDRGLTWESKIITNQPVEITTFFQVNDRILAGTYGLGVYQSTDNGESWESFNSGLGTWAEYAKTFVLSGDTLFYGTDGGGVYFATLSSSSWQSYNQNLPSNNAWTINDLAVSNENIIASAGASGFYYLRPKGSAVWIEKSMTTPSGIKTTPNVFLAIGDTIFSGSRFGIYRSLDNGYNWDSVGVSALPLNVVSLVKDNNRIYAGFTRSSGNDFFVWYSDDYGDTWNSMDHQFQFLHHLYIYDNKIWAATADGLWYDELEPTFADPVERPFTFSLEQNYPNPFNPVTSIQYVVGSKQNVTLNVYDILGNEIATLVDEEKPAGTYNIQFNASQLSSGVYFYLLQTGNYKEVKKMTLMK